MAILSGETELALGTIRVKFSRLHVVSIELEVNLLLPIMALFIQLNKLFMYLVCLVQFLFWQTQHHHHHGFSVLMKNNYVRSLLFFLSVPFCLFNLIFMLSSTL